MKFYGWLHNKKDIMPHLIQFPTVQPNFASKRNNPHFQHALSYEEELEFHN